MSIKNYLNNIELNVDIKSKKEAFELVFKLLKSNNAVKDEYLASMIERDNKSSVAIGNLIAIAHGTVESKDLILKDTIVMLVLKNPIMWDGNEVRVVLGLALSGDKTMDVIGNIGIAFSDEDEVKSIFSNPNLTAENVLDWLASQE